MIIGIGMDLVEVYRISELLRRHPERGLRRLFTDAEVEHCRGTASPDQSFAARFAAKEALFKALGTGWSGGACWNEVEVQRDRGAAPRLLLHGTTRALAETLGVRRTHVTLSHTLQMAAAYVVLEGSPRVDGPAPLES